MQTVSFAERNGELTASLHGELDHCLAVSVRRRIDDKVTEVMPGTLVLDISGITFMDSSGLGLIMGRYTYCRKLGVGFRLYGADGRAKKILEMAGLCSVIDAEDEKKGKTDEKPTRK